MIGDGHILIGASWLILLAVWMLSWFRVKPDTRHADLRSRVLELILLTSGTLLLYYGTPQIPLLDARYLPVSTAATYTGVALTTAGVAFAVAARLVLGGNWSASATIKHGHEIVRRGPYKWVRHPIYTGMITALLGTALAFGRWGDLLGIALLIAGFMLKLRSEEQLLLSEFGDRYNTYRREVRGAIIPFIW